MPRNVFWEGIDTAGQCAGIEIASPQDFLDCPMKPRSLLRCRAAARTATWNGPVFCYALPSILMIFVVLAMCQCFQTEAWGATAATVYVKSINSVIQGNQLSVTCTVTNTGTDTRTFGVGAEVLDGTTFKADLGQKTTATLSPGSYGNVTFTYTVPTSWTAKSYNLHAVVWSGTPGSSTWLDDDTRSFAVLAQTTNAVIVVRSISSVIQGNQLSVTCDVTNTSNVSRSFGVGAEVLDGATVKADLGTKTTSTISPNSSSTVTFTYTVPTSWTAKNYTLHAVVWSGTPGSSTWLDDDSRSFTVVAQTTSAVIVIRSISSVIQGNQLAVTCDVTNTSNVGRSFGVGAEVLDGVTLKADLGTKTTSTISPNSSSSVTFTYTVPTSWSAKNYNLHAVVWSGTPGSSTWLDDDTRSFTVNAQNIAAAVTVNTISPIQAGSILTIPFTVTNTGNIDNNFGVGCEIWKDSVKVADVGAGQLGNMSPNTAVSSTFTYTIPTTWVGNYIARVAVWSGAAGSSTWLSSSDRTFPVTAATLPSLTGRLAFHRDTANTNLHIPYHSDDGHVFVYNLSGGASPLKVTFGLGLGNAMNPHFSPDGSKVAFMAIPSGQALLWANMRVYVLDLAEGSIVDLGLGQDPKFSPSGTNIVFKRRDTNLVYQLWRAQADGSSSNQLTFSSGEKSGPNYSPEGTKIVYWLNGGSNADVWQMNADGSGAVSLIAKGSIQDYYPIYRDANNILYTSWDSATPPQADKIFNFEISSGISTKLGVNSAGATNEDADPFPIQGMVGFCSTRKSGWPNYDIYIGGDSGSPFGEVVSANSSIGELGGVYSPYSYARKLKPQSPVAGATLGAGANHILQVRAYSDGSAWSGAAPSVTFQGPTTQTFSDLRDDGSNGDSVAGDGIYSRLVTLPSTVGVYTVTLSAQSIEPGVTRNVQASLAVSLVSPPPPPTANAATAITSSSFSANWSLSVGASGYRIDVATSSSFGNFVSGYSDLDVGNVTSKAVSGLSAGTTYYYRLRAYNAGGTSGNSGTNSVVTVPNAPTVNVATSLTNSGFTANWNSANGATGYRFDLATNSTFASYVTGFQDLDLGNVTSKIVTGLAANRQYFYRLRAYNAYGTSVNSSTNNVTTLSAPDAFLPVIAATIQSNKVVLSWPTNDAAFKLFYATNLPATTWISNTTIPTLVNGQFRITNSMTDSFRLFRLKK